MAVCVGRNGISRADGDVFACLRYPVQNKAGVDELISALAELEPAKTLHILVNNSGVSWGSPFDAVPEDKGWDNIMAVNVKSVFYRESPPAFFTWPHPL